MEAWDEPVADGGGVGLGVDDENVSVQVPDVFGPDVAAEET